MMNNRNDFESVVAKMAARVDNLILSKVINPALKTYIIGMNKYSFMLNTILKNRKIFTSGYIIDDKELLITLKREQKNFASKYLSSMEHIICPVHVNEILTSKTINIQILAASDNDAAIFDILIKAGMKCVITYDDTATMFDILVKEKKRIDLSEIKEIEKNILKYIDYFCCINNLRYWVCGGTLLGTIRHKGFIPWDDDIDIFLPWNDWVNFVSTFSNDSNYEVLKRCKKQPYDYPFCFAKVIDKRTILREDSGAYRLHNGIWVDVFALSGLPENIDDRNYFFRLFYEYEREMWEYFYNHDGKTEGFGKWFTKEEKMQKRYDFDESKYVGVLGTKYNEKDSTLRSVYDETIRLPFEDITVNVPIGYEEYLGNLYGKSWKMIPDESNQISKHDFEAYWV